ncbi:hypothetical protein AV530_006258 [Patagioenas fasciata monilis]|uniref:Uncharacterized protein n=1 Tax=Patagioenas fasciata monilis TaxID=372326 RepID=A0A1V4KFU2_PATFA|nr:hypothetical protein AV530_006258 [Patagioenas fasciata monilis]
MGPQVLLNKDHNQILWHCGSCTVEDQIAETHMEATPMGPAGAPPAVSQEASLHITSGMLAVLTLTTTKLALSSSTQISEGLFLEAAFPAEESPCGRKNKLPHLSAGH